MPPSKSLISYADVQEALDRALASERGVIAKFMTRGAAVQFRHRCYSLRKILREKSAEVYQPGDPMYGRTPYDELIIQTPESFLDKWSLKIIRGGQGMEVEEL